MTFANARIGISRQRGFRLRCFLGAVSLAVLSGAVAPAQISILKTLHVRHLQGYVTDEAGKAVPHATIKLLREGRTVLGATADEDGWFEIHEAKGAYVLSVSAGVSEVGRDIVVETGPQSPFGSKTLYVMIRTSGSCSDCSIRVFTSKKQFFDVVWQNTGHHY